jgi:hypothetical protein
VAREFNITATDKFFLGEDKVIDLTIFGQDDATPFDVTGLPLEWNMRKTDQAADPALLVKGVGTGLSIVGVYNAVPAVNTQRVRLTFAAADTATGLKANVAYRHSLKRLDVGNKGIFSYGSLTFLQATEH